MSRRARGTLLPAAATSRAVAPGSMPVPVPAFVLATVLAGVLAAAGCGAPQADVAPAAAGTAAMGPALLSQREVPAGFLPAGPQRAFTGIRPADPDCARLLRLADNAGAREGRDASHAQAAYYRTEPGATLVQHVYRLRKGRAAALVAEAREAVTGCPKIGLDVGDDRETLLYRVPLRHARTAGETVAVRYTSRGARQAGLDVVLTQLGDDLLTVAAPGEFGRGGAQGIELAEARAIRKLRDARDRIGTAPGAPEE
ncbi:hypothetical protein [Actinomadura hibisca]|uniref:hypothetical protein n=1 Tax=Actinomadura hibisca TaxID=68565 RepID=UPI00082F7865|nr:hypothetical protein [Actinomadura hibisca]